MPSVTKSVRNVRDRFSGRRRSSTGMTVVSEVTAPAPLPMAVVQPPSEVASVASLRSDRSSVAPSRTTQPAQTHHRNLTAPPPTARTPLPPGRMSPAVQVLSTRIEDMHHEVNNKTSEITDLQFKIRNEANGTESELNALRQESERLRRDRVNYQNRMDEMQRQQDKLLQELAEMRKDFKKQRDAGSDVVRILQREQQTREEDWQREAHELRSLLTSLKYTSNDVEEGSALRRNHESAVASIGDVVMGQDKLKQFRLKEAVRINAITKRQEEQEVALQDTKEALEKLLADREKHVTSVKTMEGQHEELKQKIEEASGKTDAMREEIVADLGARDREVKRLLLETAELRKLQSSDEAHIVMLERRLNAESHEVEQLYREAEALRRKQRLEKKLLNEMQSLHVEEERMLQEMDTELQQQNRRLRHTEKEIDMVDKKLDSVAKRPQEFVEEHHHHHHHRVQRVEVEKPIEIHRVHRVEVEKPILVEKPIVIEKPIEIHHFHSNVPVRRVYA